MKVKFYGTRGSISVSGPQYQEFGGNTTCVLLTGERKVAIFDAGTGLRELGQDIQASEDPRFNGTIWMLFSHFHWDHIQGLPFFGPAFEPHRDIKVTALGKDRMKKDLRSIFEDMMDDIYFPVSLDELKAKFTFWAPGEDGFIDGRTECYSYSHNHPGTAYSYKVKGEDGTTVVFCTDIEHGDTIDENLVEFARGADLLIHDGQYTPEELETKKGWGHSSWEQCIEVAERAGVKKLAITHHDPDHDDEFLLAVEKEAQKRFPNCCLARDGMEISF